MDFITNVFNNRELATILWGFVLLVIFLFVRQIRLSASEVLRVFFQKTILLSFLAMIIYISLQVFILYKINLWTFFLVKDTVFWVVGVAAVLLVNINDALKEHYYFRKLLMRILVISVILEFIVNLYVFPFLFEMIVLPVITLLYLLAIYSETEKVYRPLTRIANFLVAIYGFVILLFSIANIIGDFSNVWTLNNLKAFLLPILLSISFIPFLYLLATYFAYESLFTRLDINIKKDKTAVRYAKKKIFALCHLNLMKLNKFNRKNALILHRFNSKEEVQKIINEFKLTG